LALPIPFIMKKNLFLFLFLFICSKQIAQNLVPNPSFEYIDSCNIFPFSAINNHLVLNWSVATQGTADDFNICSGSIPWVSLGYQYPRTGNCYAGVVIYSTSGSYPDYREYIEAKLDSPMINQEHYCVSYYINKANNCYFANNNFGVYFSDNFIYQPIITNLNFTPQINDTNIVTDTLNWTIVYGEYVAHGGEQYMIIGDFYPDSLTDTLHTGTGNGSGYYFIDDVNVHCCTCDSTTSLHAGVAEIKQEEITIYPNPTTTTLTITSTDKLKEVRMYNLLGEEILAITPNNNQSTININQFSKGIYFVEIKTEKGVVRKKVVKE